MNTDPPTETEIVHRMLRRLAQLQSVLCGMFEELAVRWPDGIGTMPYFEAHDHEFTAPGGGRRKVTQLVFVVHVGPVELADDDT